MVVRIFLRAGCLSGRAESKSSRVLVVVYVGFLDCRG